MPEAVGSQTNKHDVIRVKICGITRSEDALLAGELGATYIGFVFAPKSPRYIDPARAADIVATLPANVIPVGVFANQPRDRVIDVIGKTGIKVAQFSGLESPEYCDSFGKFGVFKAFHVREPFTFANVNPYHVTMYVLDTYDASMEGGTGTSFDWALAVPIASRARVMLAGGLTPDNVGDAATIVHPYAVDVSSGVESSPGKKDGHRIAEFFLALQRAGFACKP